MIPWAVRLFDGKADGVCDAASRPGTRATDGCSGMTEQLEITETDRDGTRQLALRGELDVATAHSVGERLTCLLAECRTIDLDLSELSFIDSTGLGVLVRATEAAEQDGAEITIGALSAAVMRVVELTGLAEKLHVSAIHPTNRMPGGLSGQPTDG